LYEQGLLKEIILVDDGSTDNSSQIAHNFPVRVIQGQGRGPSHARNLGWRACQTPWVWFIDSDCVAEKDALALLLSHTESTEVAGVGGSYGNMFPESLLASLIHEEIVVRHRSMPSDVNFLGTFNALYKRRVLEEVGGFDETMEMSEDADLAYRIIQLGYRLKFELNSRVKHHHPTALFAYLKKQGQHGYWRALVYARHEHRMSGDNYTSALDNFQPVLVLVAVALCPFISIVWPLELTLLAALLGAQLPMTLRMINNTCSARYLAFAPLGFVRSFFRTGGVVLGYLDLGKRALMPTWS